MEPPWVTDARRQLDLAEASAAPREILTGSLTAIETLLRRGAPADGQSLATLAVLNQGHELGKVEAAQVVRLSNVAQRAAGGEDVDPLDAAQAAQLARSLLYHHSPGSPLLRPPAPQPVQSPPPAVPYAVPPHIAQKAGGFPFGALLLVVVGTLLLLVILVLGPLLLALVGPPWVRWLAWPVALAVGALVIWQLFRLTSHSGVVAAALIALVAGVVGGGAWAWGVEHGMMPPLRYYAPFLPSTASATTIRTEEPVLRVGGQAIVVNTGEIGLRVRARPGLSMPEVGRLPDGSVVAVVGASQMADGLEWWRVQGAGISGWVAAIYLTPVD